METTGSTELFSMTAVCLSNPKSMAYNQIKCRAKPRFKSSQYAAATNTEGRALRSVYS